MNANAVVGERVRYALLTWPTCHMDWRVTKVDGDEIECALHAYDSNGVQRFRTLIVDPGQWSQLKERHGRAIAPDDTGL